MRLRMFSGPATAVLCILLALLLSGLGPLLQEVIAAGCPETASMAVAMGCQTASVYMRAFWIIPFVAGSSGALLLFINWVLRSAMPFGGDDPF